jgi:hypothetical protein
MNNADDTQSVKLNFNLIPTFSNQDSSASYELRDIWNHKDLGKMTDGMTVTLVSHDSAFFVVSLA